MTIIFISLMLGGTLALGASDALRKKYLKNGLDEQAFLVIILFFTGLFMLPVLIFTGIPELKNGFWSAIITTTLLNLISQNLFIRAFKLGDASLIAPLRLIIPPLVIFTGFLFLHEKPSAVGVIGIFITMIGLWFLLTGGKKDDQEPLTGIRDKGVIFGLLGSILFAISFPFDKLAVVNSSAPFTTFIIFTTLGIVTCGIHLILDRNFFSLLGESFTKHFRANMLVALLSSVGLTLTNQALNYSLVAYASSMKRLQALWTVIIAGKFLQEKQMSRRLTATAIMFLGIILSMIWR